MKRDKKLKIITIIMLAISVISNLNRIAIGEETRAVSSNITTTPIDNGSRDYWWQQLQWPESLCPRQESGDNAGVKVYKVANGRELVEIVCFLGAYQGQQIYYLRTPNGSFTLLEFDQFESPNVDLLEPYHAAEVTGTSQLITSSNQLKVFRKYRGIGDCGQLLTYSLDKVQPELIEFRTRKCEDSKAYIPPEKWRQVPIKALPRLEKTK